MSLPQLRTCWRQTTKIQDQKSPGKTGCDKSIILLLGLMFFMFKLLVSFAFGLILNGTRFSYQTVRLLVKTIQKLLQLVLYLTSGQKELKEKKMSAILLLKMGLWAYVMAFSETQTESQATLRYIKVGDQS
ncbi:hypothetical protein CSA_021504 [Cucumis sativus]|uniref:Uncharacterized protein n=1 Tax=Cucumis sativus TaxID=3659 RepID=A0ACB6HB10_CUCSA|nr:hypothetical protein CSA_021504 [Cucumis sativus]